ncbi:MAG: UDP-glucose:undecaprenyl-phosphate glucose-1-phosphate transferase [Phycisphaerae bacterium]|nr:UDP-glucose:undecaprenyl-phosphate glucose-1-phosphate transferase [Phycisphaerae bacterium]
MSQAFPYDLSLPPEAGLPREASFYLLLKRGMDLLFALAMLPIALPLMALIAVGIKLTSPGPIFFRQTRAGKDGCPFVMLKFRSMARDAVRDRGSVQLLNTTDGPTFKIRRDPRVTRFGRFLRRSSLDELPQVFHVLSGRMSLVGPRPLDVDEIRTDTIAERVRLRIKPGLTGLWQVSGRSDIPYHEWIELDFYYACHRSLLLDLQILLQTIPAVLSARGAY